MLRKLQIFLSCVISGIQDFFFEDSRIHEYIPSLHNTPAGEQHVEPQDQSRSRDPSTMPRTTRQGRGQKVQAAKEVTVLVPSERHNYKTAQQENGR